MRRYCCAKRCAVFRVEDGQYSGLSALEQRMMEIFNVSPAVPLQMRAMQQLDKQRSDALWNVPNQGGVPPHSAS